MKIFYLSLILLLSACIRLLDGIQPVKNFDVTKHQGTWYEIARLDHSFARGLEQVSAQYKIKDNGDVQVVNKGFSTEDNEWSKAVGNTKFMDKKNEGYLKVSFLKPFYGWYVIST